MALTEMLDARRGESLKLCGAFSLRPSPKPLDDLRPAFSLLVPQRLSEHLDVGTQLRRRELVRMDQPAARVE
jgi:hypothetical protein